jgi:hypothetical protein
MLPSPDPPSPLLPKREPISRRCEPALFTTSINGPSLSYSDPSFHQEDPLAFSKPLGSLVDISEGRKDAAYELQSMEEGGGERESEFQVWGRGQSGNRRTTDTGGVHVRVEVEENEI